VETLEQVSPILVLLLLVLLDGGEAFSCLRLPLGVLVKHVLDLLLVLFNGGEPVIEAGVLHLLFMIAHGLVMAAIGREGHTSSLMATRDFFILLLLIIVEVAILPLRTRALMPGALSELRSGLLPTRMLRLVHVGRFPPSMLGLLDAGRTRPVPACIAGEGRSFRNWIVTSVPGL
jgi:hypothetical protein